MQVTEKKKWAVRYEMHKKAGMRPQIHVEMHDIDGQEKKGLHAFNAQTGHSSETAEEEALTGDRTSTQSRAKGLSMVKQVKRRGGARPSRKVLLRVTP